MLRDWLVTARNIERSSYAWSMAASILAAVQSTLMVFLVVRCIGNDANGRLSIGLTWSFILWTIGCYGMRRFQASDVEQRYTMRDYVWSRVISMGLMLICGCALITVVSLQRDYGPDKIWVIVGLTAVRAVEAFEDVYVGFLQQIGRLDIGTKIQTVRIVGSTLAFVITIVTGGNLIGGLLACFVVGGVVDLVLVPIALGQFRPQIEPADWRRVRHLLWVCAPLFIGSLLAMYINNAPKDGIDSVLTDAVQSQFNIICQPVFMITLLTSLVFNPMIFSLSTLWLTRQFKAFMTSILRVSLLTVALTAALVAVGAIAGLPILEFVFGVDLSGLLLPLIVLLATGGFVAMSNLMTMVLTVVRRQQWLVYSLIPVALIGLTTSHWVRWQGILGAAWLFFALYCVITVIQGYLVVRVWRSQRGFRDSRPAGGSDH